MMARLLKVSRNGYYAWKTRPASRRDVANTALTEVIKAIHEDSRCTYGARRVRAEPLDEVRGASPGGAPDAPTGPPGPPHAQGTPPPGNLNERHQDHVSGQFTCDAPDHEWVADVTQHRTLEGWLSLSVVLDVFQRKAVDWAMDDILT